MNKKVILIFLILSLSFGCSVQTTKKAEIHSKMENESTDRKQINDNSELFSFLKKHILNYRINKYSYLYKKDVSKDDDIVYSRGLTNSIFDIPQNVREKYNVNETSCFAIKTIQIPRSLIGIKDRLFYVEYTDYSEVPSYKHKFVSFKREYYFVYKDNNGKFYVINSDYALLDSVRVFDKIQLENDLKIDKSNVVAFAKLFIETTKYKNNPELPIVVVDDKTEKTVLGFMKKYNSDKIGSYEKRNLKIFLSQVREVFNPESLKEKCYLVKLCYFVKGEYYVNGFGRNELYHMEMIVTDKGVIKNLVIEEAK